MMNVARWVKLDMVKGVGDTILTQKKQAKENSYMSEEWECG